MLFAGWLVHTSGNHSVRISQTTNNGYTLLLKIVKHLNYFSILTGRSFSRDL